MMRMVVRKNEIAVLLFIVASALPLSGRASEQPHPIRLLAHNGRNYVFFEDLGNFYGMERGQMESQLRMSSKYSEFQFALDNKKAEFNGTKVHLLFPPTRFKGRSLVSLNDFRSVLEPLLRPKRLLHKETERIILDPGHGGKDGGAEGRLYKEKKITLAIALRTADLLRDNGFKVKLTRSGDRFVPLNKRARIASEWNCDAFLSIHTNAADDAGIRGIETFVLTPEGAPSTYSWDIKTTSDPGDRYIMYNTALGFALQENMLQLTEAQDKGLKHANYLVLRESACPSALVEVGFLSNPEQERQMGRKTYQSKIARALVQGLMKYRRKSSN